MDKSHDQQTIGNGIVAPCVADPFDANSACPLVRPSEPCCIVILGATGDLTARKLMPALYHLYQNQALPEPLTIVGCGRTPLDQPAFREKMEAAVSSALPVEREKLERFLGLIFYQNIAYDDPASFDSLARYLKELDQRQGTGGNRVFYLALPPSVYQTVSSLLGRAGLSAEKEKENGWSRLVVEKPFGRDLQTARNLDDAIHRYFEEHQVFRIDHYLAKETVQNILMFRFANTIFEPIWNRRYIEHVRIAATETLGIGNRAGYYEQAGVLRDMFQNHMMQLLALTAMEPPSAFDADLVQDEKVKLYRSIRPFPVDNLQQSLILGQYGQGVVDGQPVPAYRQEPGVVIDSLVPTFATMKVLIDNWRWQGVPFYLTSGKRLARKLTEIAIQFKEVPHSMFRQTLGGGIVANRLTLGIYPDEKITLTFQTKTPGTRVQLRSVTMDFNYYQDQAETITDAYEKVLVDCMLGDRMLFWRSDAVELCWSYLTPILTGCEICGDRAEMLFPYEAGSWGPGEAHSLLGIAL